MSTEQPQTDMGESVEDEDHDEPEQAERAEMGWECMTWRGGAADEQGARQGQGVAAHRAARLLLSRR
eukprot:3674201-Rhodomonas_salina.1